MAMPQCCYLAKGAKRPSHTTNTIKFDRIPFNPCNSIKRFELCPFDQKNSTYLQPPLRSQLDGEPTTDSFWTNITPEKVSQIRYFYNQVVQWKPQFITLPKNKTGHKFRETMNCLMTLFAENSSKANIALYAAMLLPHLILARTSSEPDTSQNQVTTRRLRMWLTGETEVLFLEAEVLQKRSTKPKSSRKKDELSEFDAHMSAGKISNALRCINDCEKGGVLSLTEKIDNKSVLDILKEKHPPASRCDDRYIVEKPPNVTPYHTVIFDKNQGRIVCNAAMKTHGSHGPSGVDANELLSIFNQSSTLL